MDLARVLKSYLSPTTPQLKPQNLSNLCLRSAAVYVTTSLYDFHLRQTHHVLEPSEIQVSQFGETIAICLNGKLFLQETMWDEVFPLLDAHFFCLIPLHLYECFLDKVLSALEVAGHYDLTGKQLMQYITLFFPKHIKRFRAQR